MHVSVSADTSLERPTGARAHGGALRRASRRARHGAGAEHGVTLVLMVIVMFVTSLLIAASFTLATKEIHFSAGDTAAKQAYYAALAGINDYAYHLNQEPNYLNYCTSPPVENPALNQYYKAGTETPLKGSELKTANVSGSSNEKYAIQLVPAKSAPSTERSCEKENHITESMIEEESTSTAGTFSILSTGFATAPGRSKPIERTILATFRNLGFASFVYYTEYETEPPVIDEGGTLTEEQQNKCRAFYGERPSYCAPVSFVSLTGMTDELKGPVHTEDHVSVCNSPIFGRNSRDRIEFVHFLAKPDEGYSTEGQCSVAEPIFKGTKVPRGEVESVTPPPDDKELELIAKEESQEPYPSHFTGRTEITLEGAYMTVNDEGKTYSHIPFPTNGVVYVSESSCKYSYKPEEATYSATEEKGCGDVFVKGEYNKSLTIGAQNSIIIDGSITTPTSGGVPTTHALLGLVANEYVRIYHPAEFGWGGCTNKTSSDVSEYEIWAAILAVQESFVVDNFQCGPALGKLKLHGALAQIFRGPVGTFSGSKMASGYTKEYEYDERLRAAEPPRFLNPVEAAWRIERETIASSPIY
jgi:Tfp pilus assembly protein PilX